MNKSDLNIDALTKALLTIKEAWGIYKVNIDKDKVLEGVLADSCVKRFEYTVETAWKLMKKYLKLEYGKKDEELTINNIFRLMQSYGLIENWESWKDYYAKRNDTSHEYNIEKARELLNIIPGFIKDTEFLQDSLAKALGESE